MQKNKWKLELNLGQFPSFFLIFLIMDSCEAHGQLAHKINHELYISLLIQCTHLGWYGMDYFP